MNLSGFEGRVLSPQGYLIDGVRRQPTLALARQAAEEKYTEKGWGFEWTSETTLTAYDPKHDYITERLRIEQLDASLNIV